MKETPAKPYISPHNSLHNPRGYFGSGTATLLTVIAVAAAFAAAIGIFSDAGPGPREHQSVRGETVPIYGYGPYRHMSADVAVQGIGQDYVTLFIAVPLLVGVAVATLRREGTRPAGSLRRRLLLAGITGYFFVTYLFYMLMGTYNYLFLVYLVLAGSAFFALARILLSIDSSALAASVDTSAPTGISGLFLMVNAVLIALMWLGVVVPPLLDGTIYPEGLDHYTTMVVQGLDLSILLPLSLISGVLLRRRTPLGLVLGPTYLVFLALLMTALSAKIIAMAITGVNVIPAVFIIPAINSVTIVLAVTLFRRL
jgi:hypothetical protein